MTTKAATIRSIFPGLGLAVLALSWAACEETDDVQEPRGACIWTWDHHGAYADGPEYCRVVFESTCADPEERFLEGSTCDQAGFDFCCETEFSGYRFRSMSDAAWYDELSDPAGNYEDCASNQVTCEDETSDLDEAEEGDADSDADGDGDGGDDDSCTSSSSCGSREACRSGRCVSVECTSDSHCGSCSRCTENTCRDCGSGPYGCYC